MTPPDRAVDRAVDRDPAGPRDAQGRPPVPPPLVGPRHRGGSRGRPRGTFPPAPDPLPRPVAGTGLRTTAGPLVARRDPVGRRGPRRAHAGGRFARFVARWGWRAYAVPLLSVLTVLALVDVAVTGTEPAASASGASAPSVGAPASSSSAAPTSPAAAVLDQPPAPAEGEADPTDLVATTGPASYVETGAGTVSVVDGTSAVYGTGPLRRFVVEVEDGIGMDGPAFAAAVEATLGDPRSWGHDGAMSFQRVGAAEAAAGDYDFRVSLVSPGSMETYCPGVGTGGYTSCRYGERAVINLARWETAVPDYAGDIATYRQYVVNHEVGHALGNGHQPCPGPGQLAPVMQQQTLGLQGCAKNAWPFP
ncbi:DUF3152 domain-containing protein [Klenkia brasiliensis]|uniref:DUF3152 domain-containing protein n=1 Tax=Klenkia brasiliensis TaxID=333142 RepID=A0A1G7WFB1_9ACTN|nr:DUF3152 domain-containing protein [Klenkia brasiliensis]SDG69850.1 Protein of unknown function [Klenkia brasiliensis]